MFYTNSNLSSNLGQKKCYTYKYKNLFAFIFLYFSLRSVVDKPPIGGKELLPLTGHSLSGFRLNPGPVSVLNSLKHE